MDDRFKEFFGPDFFDRFFRKRSPREEGRASGSGVIVDAQGYILTNAHVVENAAEIEVGLSDDRKFKATLVGRDPKTDLAVLRVEAPTGTLPVAELGDSDRLRVGQWAIAIGNPFGLDRTVTAGIISATGRTQVGVATYEAFIQTDASINPGNSGGPLLNLQGRVIGINTAIVASGQGIGFAIPINMAREVMGQLISRGRVVRGWLGIVIQDLTADLAAGFGLPDTGGVLISDVMKDSPAETAGMRAGRRHRRVHRRAHQGGHRPAAARGRGGAGAPHRPDRDPRSPAHAPDRSNRRAAERGAAGRGGAARRAAGPARVEALTAESGRAASNLARAQRRGRHRGQAWQRGGGRRHPAPATRSSR